MSAARRRVACAPITWGVCEVEGWGHQLEPRTVLASMRSAGAAATELGPAGFFPDELAAARSLLREHELQLAGAFVAAVLHEPSALSTTMELVDAACQRLSELGGATLVLAAATGAAGYDARQPLDAPAWARLLRTVDDIAAYTCDRGIDTVVHPHVGTHVEDAADIERLLAHSQTPICLDTGHVLVGGADPVALAVEAAGRIGHVHLKDVDPAIVERVSISELTYSEGVARGMYVPLGHGAVRTHEIVAALDAAGYDGWYVLEQDRILDAPDAAGIGRDVAASIAVLDGLQEALA